MNKYNNGKIYTIRCETDNNLIYVGSTVQPLYKRWNAHKSIMYNENNKNYNLLFYTKVREIGLQHFYIELYEDYNCQNKEQLNKREGEIIRQIGTLNQLIAGRTQKEYYQDNKEKFQMYDKEYYKENKDKINETKKIYREKNQEKLKLYKKKYDEENKDKQKDYYELNKEIIIQKVKENYDKNKEKYISRKKEKVICDCGCEIGRGNLNEHKKSKKHNDLMNNINI